MLNRWIGILSLGAMGLANAALFSHDLLPIWLAGDPPPSAAVFLDAGEGWRLQAGIYDSRGLRIGTTWTDTRATENRIRVFSRTNLRPLRIQSSVTPEIVVRSNLMLDRDGALDELDMGLDGLGATIRLKGERFSTTDFACEWQVGDQRGNFVLPADATRSLGDAIRPFDSLHDLYVGRAWRLELVNPLAYIMPRVNSKRFESESVLVRVTAEEKIRHRGVQVHVYRVEAPNLRAWVASDGDFMGRVLRQEVDLPILGTLTIVDEPYTERAWYSGGLDLPAE